MAQAAALEGIKQRVEEQGGKIWEMETELENFLLENTGIQETAQQVSVPSLLPYFVPGILRRNKHISIERKKYFLLVS
jgi:hypothetical protein